MECRHIRGTAVTTNSHHYWPQNSSKQNLVWPETISTVKYKLGKQLCAQKHKRKSVKSVLICVSSGVLLLARSSCGNVGDYNGETEFDYKIDFFSVIR